MRDYGWTLKTHKKWAKSLKINMFRLNFMNVLTFNKKPCKVNQTKNFKPDVFLFTDNQKYKNFGFGMPVEMCKLLIEEHTTEDQVVYDPFREVVQQRLVVWKPTENILGMKSTKKLLIYVMKD